MNRSRPQKILIVGINYAPEHAGIAPYTTAAAEHFAAEGHDVRVLTGIPHYPDWTVPQEYRRKVAGQEQVNGVDITRLRHFVPRTQTAVKRATYEISYAAHVWTRGDDRRPDVVLAVVPSLLSALAAVRIAETHGARLVVWVQDSMAAAASQSGMSGGGMAARLIRPVEGWIMRRADAVAVISEPFRQHVEEAGAASQAVTLVRNWSHVGESTGNREATRADLHWEDDIIVLHAGNMGLKQGLENVVAAAQLAAATNAPIRFVLMGDGSQRTQLEQLCQGNPRAEILDPVPGERFSDVLAAADVLLINEAETVLDMSLPSKLTSYLMAARPVLAAVAPNGGTAREVERSGAGRVVASGRPDLLLQAAIQLGADEETAKSIGQIGREYALEHLMAGDALLKLGQCMGLNAPTKTDSAHQVHQSQPELIRSPARSRSTGNNTGGHSVAETTDS